LQPWLASTAAGTTIATANIGNRRFILFTFSLVAEEGTRDLTLAKRNFT
jgi:hypothetical protein